ncbi:LysR family transcriptional regulator [Pectobacteriaceae bacterium CE70]|uniref:LysR family transcriptional regulator n=1 Tax=Serratia sp. (strain ATCC 39006) TaxID=104623 RepID=A0A2I5T1W4_SERS3|nr:MULTISPECIES: LysR family transcriptional regulator [Enterobacterales]WJV62796.1 LysR family transcriptional regulator [Pectobacteriaceae bacterium C52]WJV67131.1 LysR family transcriptional regulator [Pectobacteriaceae bacterium CE70]WJY11115.1 LysR family transcriptional regulator [Pectobacteriaceae bacterium C80]AUG98535.1 LysR family transcriptional regulator [Serratia sp. ATCC 39006]AUH02850.1 LysR family transcriptional regulator [Serratia sp. ATCC 39006]
MRLRHIEVFQAIVQAGTISGAARLLNVSQPNVSRVLSHAEQQLGFALFERRAQGLIATVEGQRLIPEVQALYNHLQAINSLTEQIRKGKGQTVRLGAAHAFGQMIVAPAMVEYHQQALLVNVELVTEHFSTLCQNILQHQLDFALVFGQQVPSDLLAEPLFQSTMMALLPKDSPQQGPVTLEWLCDNNLLMMQQQDPLGQVVHRALRDKGLKPAASLFIKTYSVIADMVLAGGGTGIVDLFTARRYADQLKIVPIAQPLPFEVMLISRRDTPQSRAALQLKHVLKNKCWELASQCSSILNAA